MSAALIGTRNVAGLNSGTSSSLDTTGASLLVIHVSFLSSIPPTVSDSKGNTWTGLTASDTVVSNADRLYYVLNPTVGAGHTFSFTGTGSATQLVAAAFSGIASFDLEGSGNVGGTSASGSAPGPLVPSVANALVVTGFSWGNNSVPATIDNDGAYVVTDSVDFLNGSNFGGAFAYKITSTSTTPNWVNGGIGRRCSVIAGFKPSTSKAKGYLFGPGWYYGG